LRHVQSGERGVGVEHCGAAAVDLGQPQEVRRETAERSRDLAQFSLLVVVNALVGGMVGQEPAVLPLLAEREFQLTGYTVLLTYVLVFRLSKAATNYFAGTWSDRFGRKPVLVAGWLIAIPVPVMLIWADHWAWIVAANLLLGINQGLTWSTTVIMKVDLAPQAPPAHTPSSCAALVAADSGHRVQQCDVRRTRETTRPS